MRMIFWNKRTVLRDTKNNMETLKFTAKQVMDALKIPVHV